MLVMIEHSKINILQIRFISHQRLSTIIKNHNHKCNPNIMPMLFRNFLIKSHHDASVWFKYKCEQLCKHKISQQDFQLLALKRANCFIVISQYLVGPPWESKRAATRLGIESQRFLRMSPAAVIVPASLALFTQSKKVDLGILKDSWIVLDFTPFLSIVRATFVLLER